MILILGGGISGIAAALELRKSKKDFLLLEAEDHCGGKIQSRKVQDHTIELGPNTVLINNRESKEFLEEIELWDQRILPDSEAVKNRFVLKNSQIEPIPNSIKTAFSSNLLKLSTLKAVFSEYFKAKSSTRSEESLADFIRRRFNEQILDDLITPFVSGIYAGDPEKMSVDSTFPLLVEAENKFGSVLKGMPKLLKVKKEKESEWNPPKQKMFTFKNGLQTMIENAEEKLEDKIKYQCRIMQIDRADGKYLVKYQEKGESKEILSDKIISCLPAEVLSKALQFDRDICSTLEAINYVPAIVTHFAFSKEDLILSGKRFGILTKKTEQVPFLGLLFNSDFFPHTAPDGSVLLTVISGGYRQAEMINSADSEIKELLLNSLKELKIIKGEPSFARVMKWHKAIPQYEVGRQEIDAKLEEFEKLNPDFYLGGNYFRGVSVSDCIKNGINLARKID